MTRTTQRLLFTAGLVLSAAVALQVTAQPRRAAAPRHRPPAPKVATIKPTAAPTRPTDPYRAVRRRNLFQPLVLPKPAAPAQPPIDWNGLAESPSLPPSLPAAGGSDLGVPADDWVYCGFAEVDGALVAILQRPTSKEAMFVREGDTTPEGQVTQITPEVLTLVRNGEQVQLACSTDFIATPLNAVETTRRTPESGRPGPGGTREERMRSFLRGVAERLGFMPGRGGDADRRGRWRSWRERQGEQPAAPQPGNAVVVNHLDASENQEAGEPDGQPSGPEQNQ